MTSLDRFRHSGRVIFFTVAVLCIGAIGFLALEIARDLRLLNTANSDNVQWTLSQAEVELLELQYETHQAQLLSDADLEEMIEEFDIFYSRIMTLYAGTLYAPLRELPEFAGPLTDIKATLDAMIPIIDGPRADLVARLPHMDAQLIEARGLVRDLATAGLYYFARQSDAQRDNVAVTLSRVAGLTATLVLALAFLLRHTQRTTRQTERRGHELSAAYARLNTILETSLDGVVVSDMQGRIQQFSTAAERIFGYSEQEVIGRTIGEVIIPDHLRDAHDAGMERMHTKGERRVVGHGRVRLEAMRKGGEVFPVELALETAQSGEDEIVVGFLRDISHRVAAENELVDARDKALAGEKAKADFLAMMTHEIRTPLNGLLGNLALLQETALGPDQARYSRNMSISGDLLMSHVDAVLDVARFESGASVSKEIVVHLGRLVQDIVDSQSSAAEARGNVLEWGWVGGGLDWVSVDGSRLQQVLLNLLGNAIKFTRQGRIQIELESVAAEPSDSPAPEGQALVEIRVIDTGVGIDEAELARVFEDFQTVVSPMTQSEAGTGLGLGIARRFVEAMGGEIGAESAPGEGSVFWVRIPVTRAAPPVVKVPKAATEQRAVARDVLLVEDNEINLQLASAMLRLLGHRVTVARNGQEALEAATAQRFDLILMDIRMPVMDGLAATRAIRDGQGASRAAPIVALSANVLPEARARFIAEGMSDFLGKPLVKAELSQVIDRFCTEIETEAEVEDDPVPSQSEAEDPLAGLTRRYVEETRDLFDWLTTEPDDWTEIADRAHRIAGSAAAFGQADLRMGLLHVEAAAEAADPDALRDAVAKARAAWKAAPAPSLA